MSTILVCSDARHSKNNKVDNPKIGKSTYLAISSRVVCLNQDDRLVSYYRQLCDYGTVEWLRGFADEGVIEGSRIKICLN
jgi:hypothetical protein